MRSARTGRAVPADDRSLPARRREPGRRCRARPAAPRTGTGRGRRSVPGPRQRPPRSPGCWAVATRGPARTRRSPAARCRTPPPWPPPRPRAPAGYATAGRGQAAAAADRVRAPGGRASWRHRQPVAPDRSLASLPGVRGRGKPAMLEDKDPPALAGSWRLVRDEDDGAVGQLVIDGDGDPGRAGRVEVGGGLVEQDDRDPAQERPGQRDLL